MRLELENLESRALLSALGTVGKVIIPQLATAKPTIAQLPTAPHRTVSTIPGNGDVNPYGVAFVPAGIARGGKLQPNDLLVSNFNNSHNLQGTGTTIMLITPRNQVSVFYKGPPGIGLSTALDVLEAGYVIVGFVPSTNGMSNTAGQGGLLVLNKNGNIVAEFTSKALSDGPWDMTVNDAGNRAQVFVANVLNGTVSRFDLVLSSTGAKFVSSAEIASGYMHHGDPVAFEIGPTGLAFKDHTLYVASTGDDAVYAIHNADTALLSFGKGTVVYRDKGHLHGPLGLTWAPDGNLIAAEGDAINANANNPSELTEFTTSGRFVGQFSLSTAEGGAFGVATSSNNEEFAAVNDNTNSVTIWSVVP
jgi:hypothetical protein